MVFWLSVLGAVALLVVVGVLLDRRWGSPDIAERDDLPVGWMQKHENGGSTGFGGGGLGGGL